MSVANPGGMTQWGPAARVSLHSTQATPFRGQRSLTFRHGPGGITPPGCRDCQGTSEVPYRTRACGGDPAIPVRRAAHSPRNRRFFSAFAARENVLRLLFHRVVTRQRQQLALRRLRAAIRSAARFRRRQTNDQSVGSLPIRPFATGAHERQIVPRPGPCQLFQMPRHFMFLIIVTVAGFGQQKSPGAVSASLAFAVEG